MYATLLRLTAPPPQEANPAQEDVAAITVDAQRDRSVEIASEMLHLIVSQLGLANVFDRSLATKRPRSAEPESASAAAAMFPMREQVIRSLENHKTVAQQVLDGRSVAVKWRKTAEKIWAIYAMKVHLVEWDEEKYLAALDDPVVRAVLDAGLVAELERQPDKRWTRQTYLLMDLRDTAKGAKRASEFIYRIEAGLGEIDYGVMQAKRALESMGERAVTTSSVRKLRTDISQALRVVEGTQAGGWGVASVFDNLARLQSEEHAGSSWTVLTELLTDDVASHKSQARRLFGKHGMRSIRAGTLEEVITALKLAEGYLRGLDELVHAGSASLIMGPVSAGSLPSEQFQNFIGQALEGLGKTLASRTPIAAAPSSR